MEKWDLRKEMAKNSETWRSNIHCKYLTLKYARKREIEREREKRKDRERERLRYTEKKEPERGRKR